MVFSSGRDFSMMDVPYLNVTWASSVGLLEDPNCILNGHHLSTSHSTAACNDLPPLIHHNAAHAAILAPRVAWLNLFPGHQKPFKKGYETSNSDIYPRVIKLGRLESPLKGKNGGFIPGKMIYEREQLQQATFDYRRVGCFVIQFPSMTPPDWTSCAVSLDHVWTKTRSPI